MKREELIRLRGKESRIHVAKELGITPQMLGHIERGSRSPSRKLTKKIANYYGITTDQVISFIDKEDHVNPTKSA